MSLLLNTPESVEKDVSDETKNKKKKLNLKIKKYMEDKRVGV